MQNTIITPIKQLHQGECVYCIYPAEHDILHRHVLKSF